MPQNAPRGVYFQMVDKGTQQFLGWGHIILGIIVGGYPLIGIPSSPVANVILGILVLIGGIWLLAAK